MSDFEREIEQELHRVLDPTLAGSIPSWRVPPSASFRKRLLGGAGVALGVKVLTGIAVAAAAATVAGAATETVITGSVSPAVWGQQVKLQVDACKDRLSAGQHGIGDCMSDFTSKHEETPSDSRPSPEAADNKTPGDKKPVHPAPPAKKNARQSPSASSTGGTGHPSTDRTGSQSHAIPPRP
jgi:hypothetical protein